MQNIDKMTEEEILASMEVYGQYLARLLHVADLPQEQKDAWAALVPEMSLEQLQKLEKILERYVDVQAETELKPFIDELVAIRDTYDAQVGEVADQALSELTEIEAEVRALENESNPE